MDPQKPPCSKFRYLHYLLRCRKYRWFFHFDLGVIILTGVGGLGKSFNSTKPHVNPWGIRLMKIPCFKFSYSHYLLCCRKYCWFFHLDLGMKIPTGIGGLGKSFNSTKPHVNPWGIGPMKTSFALNSVIYIIYYVVVNIFHFSTSIWVWKS